MGNGYPVVQPDELTQLRDTISTLARRIRELERPTGSQSAATVADLAARTVTISTNPPFTGSFTNANYPETNTGTSITLRLATSRQVLVQTLLKASLATSGSLNQVTVTHSIWADGNSAGGPAVGSIGSATSTGVNAELPLVGATVMTLGAGSHTLFTSVRAVVSGSGSGILTEPVLIVTVLQEA